jgi:type VI secretion system protein VasD
MIHAVIGRLANHYSGYGALCILLLCMLSACSSMKSWLTPKRQAQLNIEATAQLNLDITDKPSPLIVWVYQLSSVDEFNNQDFFSLYASAQATLGSQLLDQKRLVLTPGTKQPFNWSLQPETNYLGIFAIYRNLDNTTWKQTLPINKKIYSGKLTLVFGSQGIEVKG